jgi:hypothetical protein
MTPTTSQESTVLSTSDTARAVRAAEAFLSGKLGDYDSPPGGDEFDSWEGTYFEVEDESELDSVSDDAIKVSCTVVAECGGATEMYFVTVTLSREFNARSHDLDAALGRAAADAAADAYTARAEAGFPDA